MWSLYVTLAKSTERKASFAEDKLQNPSFLTNRKTVPEKTQAKVLAATETFDAKSQTENIRSRTKKPCLCVSNSGQSGAA